MKRRTFAGAWIETQINACELYLTQVAPSRVRGLKRRSPAND